MRMHSVLLVMLLLSGCRAPSAAGAPVPGATAPQSSAPRTSAPRAAALAVVSGVVRDSTTLAPLIGAVVQLSSVDAVVPLTRAAHSDSLGRYRIDDVPPGRYLLGFLHPRLDSLGLQASVIPLRVRQGRDLRADLTTPSAALLRAEYCGPGATTGALLIGVVRRASDRAPVEGAQVVGEWLEFVMRGTRLERQQPALHARTGPDGGFALCNVPAQGSVFVSASAGADTTDRIELVADKSGVMRRDLFVAPVPSRRGGDALLRGTVRTADGDLPLPGALVRLADGPQTRANARGEWTLGGLPGGTRVLEVRAIGYYPVQRAVDVVAGEGPVAVSLFTFQSVLDTVRIVASRTGDRSGGGFERRSRTLGAGSFLGAESIRRRGGVTTADIFRSINGVRLQGSGLDRTIMMRGSFGDCTPAVFVDGLYMATPLADELDLIAPRDRITGIEVYNDATTPAEFQRGLSGCGAIVIWTRPARAVPRRR